MLNKETATWFNIIPIIANGVSLSTTPAKAIDKQELTKKQQYLESCQEQKRHFAPYVVDTYGLLGEEAKVFNKRVRLILAEK